MKLFYLVFSAWMFLNWVSVVAIVLLGATNGGYAGHERVFVLNLALVGLFTWLTIASVRKYLLLRKEAS